MLDGLPFLYRQFWSDFVQTGNEAYNEFYDDPFVQAYVLYTFTSVFHRANPSAGAKFLGEAEYRSHIVPILKKDPHLLHTFAATSQAFTLHLRELSYRGSFQVDVHALRTAEGPAAWLRVGNICNPLQMNVPYFKATLSHYLGLHRQCLEELGITRAASTSKAVRAYEQAEKDFRTFDQNLDADVSELTRFIWRRPHSFVASLGAVQKREAGDFTDLPNLARSAHFNSSAREKHAFPRELRDYEVYLGDVLIRAYEQIENLREWTGLPFERKTFQVLQAVLERDLPTIHHPQL